MILRKQKLALLLLLPVLSSAAVIDLNEKTGTQGSKFKDAVADVGTRDAPVDGLDGKPHAGPYVVDSSKDKSVRDEYDTSTINHETLEDVLADQKAKLLADSQDGVMEDPDRVAPRKGTTGTEGGVSERNKVHQALEEEKGSKLEKVPVSPDQARPLAHDEQERIGLDPIDGELEVLTPQKGKGAAGLEKPTDLPDTPYSDTGASKPVIPSVPDDLDSPSKSSSKLSSTTGPVDDEEEGIIQPFHSYVLSLTMILVSEVGDKTFLVAALMAMRHPRVVVFTAAFSALIGMTVLSAVLGHAVPTLLPKKFTSFMAAILFLVFGVKMLREGLAMSPDEGVGEEMKEVEQELEEKEQAASKRRRSSVTPYVLEAGRARRSRSNSRLPAHRSPSSSRSRSPSPSGSGLSRAAEGLGNLFSLLLSPAWVQTFAMTFLGEWGDRSQIATIAMAAGQDYWWVTAGAVSGHAVCTSVAVLGGRAIAGKVSMRVVTLGGAIAFLVFGVIYFIEAAYSE